MSPLPRDLVITTEDLSRNTSEFRVDLRNKRVRFHRKTWLEQSDIYWKIPQKFLAKKVLVFYICVLKQATGKGVLKHNNILASGSSWNLNAKRLLVSIPLSEQVLVNAICSAYNLLMYPLAYYTV